MWIIQISKTSWVDAKKIDNLYIESGKLKFTLTSDAENAFTVDKDFEGQFLNHLGAINKNHYCPIESQVEEAKK